MRFLYARVSSCDGSQKIDRQTTEIEKYDEIFEDYASGGSTNRPKLQEMLKWVRKGDVIPLPNILIELGFLDYVAYRKKKGKTKLFELTYGEDRTKQVEHQFVKRIGFIICKT